jgi:hypothetical protein
MSTSLTEKYIKWSDKVRSGSSSIFMVTRVEGAWYFVSNGHAQKLSTARIIVYDGDDMIRSEYTGTTPSESNCVLLIKNDQKMLLFRGEDHLDAFGMDSADSTAKIVILYARTSQVHILVTAHQSSPSVNVMFFPVIGENDALSLCVQTEGIFPCDKDKREDAS